MKARKILPRTKILSKILQRDYEISLSAPSVGRAFGAQGLLDGVNSIMLKFETRRSSVCKMPKQETSPAKCNSRSKEIETWRKGREYGLVVFPSIYNRHDQLLLTQRLEPSVLYMAPREGRSVFITDNQPRDGVDTYLCSIYTRGWQEFKEFAARVGRKNIVAGGYHSTALPQDVLKHASKVVVGYCGNIEEILEQDEGIHRGNLSFRPMRRDLIDQKSLCQVYPDVMPDHIVGSMVSSVGCPFNCDFCSTPQMSERKLHFSGLEYVEAEIADLISRKVNTVFIRDESFAARPEIKEVVELFNGQFDFVYSFGTGSIIGQQEELVQHLAENGWHSLNFGLEDVAVHYTKNNSLSEACRLCRKHGLQTVLSFIVNPDGKSQPEALDNYQTLLRAFKKLKPSQVCANFLMPLPGTASWSIYRNRICEQDFVKYDSKTPILCDPSLVDWHRRMIVAVQVAYYFSDTYRREVREFECGDTLHLRFKELMNEYDLNNGEWNSLLDLQPKGLYQGWSLQDAN